MAEAGLTEARYWEQAEGGRVRCLLCPHACRLGENQVGLCRVRRNVEGRLRTLNYSRISSAHWDPIEKKPLFHFHPGSPTLSLGTIGCNLACAFCQNWSISQGAAGTRRLTPQEALRLAAEEDNNLGVAYTYNEPFIWYEFVLETAKLIREAGLKNVLVTNGYVNEAPLRELLPHIDAMNVDVKSMSENFYRELCRGRPEPPRRTVEIAKQAGCHIEITNLVIPNWNDRDDDFQALIDWVSGLGKDVPLHFSRYHPDYKFTEPPTPAETLFRARDMARKKLDYVYVGNLGAAAGEDTTCPSCGKVVVARRGFSVSQVSVQQGRCEFCGGEISIVGT
ncbi:MAG: AmmeMemoRadiSam system radical SAM enzyme [Armatimonadota bacterium]|nr:MAG: AmmeMemoRadiSam system radical SAM enzyme [Armatimonadota bacterium]